MNESWKRALSVSVGIVVRNTLLSDKEKVNTLKALEEIKDMLESPCESES